jgi:hypothetical protein
MPSKKYKLDPIGYYLKKNHCLRPFSLTLKSFQSRPGGSTNDFILLGLKMAARDKSPSRSIHLMIVLLLVKLELTRSHKFIQTGLTRHENESLKTVFGLGIK